METNLMIAEKDIFFNREEDFVVGLAPANSYVSVKVTYRSSNRLLTDLEFIKVEKFEIIADEKNYACVFLIAKKEETIKYIEIDFKPYFKLIIKEELFL